jgi:hypothetical protein
MKWVVGGTVGASVAVLVLSGCASTQNSVSQEPEPASTGTSTASPVLDRYGLPPSDPAPTVDGPLVPAPGSSSSAAVPPGTQPKLGPKVGLNSECRNLVTDGNRLCVMNDPQGYRMWYHKTEGDSFHASFRLECPSGWSADQGFTASKGHEYSYVFKIGNKGACYGWLYNLNSGAKYRVGPVHF